MKRSNLENGRGFPKIAGIVLHQVLQWHRVFTSAGFPARTRGNLELHVMWDGFFHILTYGFTLTGMIILWRKAHLLLIYFIFLQRYL